MQWIPLISENQLQDIMQLSTSCAQVIFKHSTRCSISVVAKARLDNANSGTDTIPFYYLDLLNYRSISNTIANMFHVEHESPQILVIKNGVCTYTTSHNGIRMEDIIEHAK